MVDGYVGTVETERLGDSLWVLKLAGEHDLSTAPAIGDALGRIAECGTTVVIDLTQTSFLDSTVIGAFVRHADRDETLLLVAPAGETPRRVLDLVGMTSRMKTFATRDEALRAVPPEDRP
jgi:anti-anti-sigma factor